MRAFGLVLFAFFLCCSSLIAQGPLKYNFEYFNTENGLPTNAIKGLKFDESTRFLWIATESGIVRYNGYSVQSFGDGEQNTDLNGRVVFLDRTIKGELFGKLANANIFTINENLASKVNNKFIKSQTDILNYKYGLNYQNGDDKQLGLDFIDFKFNNKYYFTSEVFFHEYTNKGIDTIAKIDQNEKVFQLSGRLFFLKENGQVGEVEKLKKGSITFKNNSNLNLPNGINLRYSNKISIFKTSDDKEVYLLVGTNLYGIGLNENKLIARLITNQMPSNELIKYLQIDKLTNTIYLGTDNRGIIVGKPKYFERVLPSNVVPGASTSAYAQLLLKNGNIQISNGQIFGENKSLNTSVIYKNSSQSTFITKDSLFFFTNGDGLIEYDLKKNSIHKKHKNIVTPNNSYVEFDNQLLYINKTGVYKRDEKENWNQINKFAELPYDFIVYATTKVSDSDLLVATTRGLYKYNFQRNTFNSYYNEKSNISFRSIYSLKNYYLLGTYGSGVYMYYKDSVKKVPLDQNKYLNYTHCFIEDNKGNIWASTNKGLFRSPGSSLIDFWNKGPGNIKFKYFGKPEGIDQLEFNGGCNPCAIKLSNGKISFPSIDGLIQFNPDSIPDYNVQPKIYLDKLLIDGNIVSSDSLKYDFSAKVKNVEIQLGLSGMLSQENIMLEYKLDNDPWVRVNVKNANIKYNNPGYGKHTILVRIRHTIDSKWDQVEYTFTIKYPWFLNPYMFVVYFLLIIVLVLLYIRFKTLIYQRRQIILEKEVDAKTESLNKLNKYLLSRDQAKDHVIAIMNHDVLTPLKYLHITAKNIADTSKEENVKSSIKQIAKTSKELEYLTSNMLNWVKFDNVEALSKKQAVDLYDLVNELVEYVEPFKQNENVLIVNQIPEGLIIQNWADSLRVLLYNLVVNAIHSTSSGRIHIAYHAIDTGYEIWVTDTGIGMNESMIQYLLKGKNKDEVEQIPKYKKGNGVGFQIIRNIVKLMQANIAIESELNQGTTIKVIFKY